MPGVVIGGRVYQVAVSRAASGFRVTVDGREHTVDAARVDRHTLSLLVGAGTATAHERVSREVTVAPDKATGQVVVGAGPVLIGAIVNGRHRSGRKDDGARAAGPQRLVAPMPGKVVRVLVKAGDVVAARQPLVVVEAMKMENELRAASEGRVAELPAREGQSIDAGTLLAVVIPV
jgi:biotin carboxyl carrier protein